MTIRSVHQEARIGTDSDAIIITSSNEWDPLYHPPTDNDMIVMMVLTFLIVLIKLIMLL
jgi:hypothetical protein